jgi:hypothetical protein
LQEGQEESEGNQIILADFQNLLPGGVLYNLLADFSIIEVNKPHPFIYNNIKRSLGLLYTGYMR